MKLDDMVCIMWSKTANCDGYVEEEVKITNMPRGEGDLICFEQQDGTEMFINPYHPYFLGIKAKRGEK